MRGSVLVVEDESFCAKSDSQRHAAWPEADGEISRPIDLNVLLDTLYRYCDGGARTLGVESRESKVRARGRDSGLDSPGRHSSPSPGERGLG
jgi:hypothetical protein